MSERGPERAPRPARGATMGPMVEKKKKASGVNIPEAQRGTVAVKLRVPPDVKDDLDALAERWGLTVSGAVARLVERASERTEDT